MSICAHRPQFVRSGGANQGIAGLTAPMLRAEHLRSLLRGAVATAWLGCAVTACQGPDQFFWGEATGFGGNISSGMAGNISSGVAGTSAGGAAGGPGTAGSILTGTGGSGGGRGGMTGAAGGRGADGRGG